MPLTLSGCVSNLGSMSDRLLHYQVIYTLCLSQRASWDTMTEFLRYQSSQTCLLQFLKKHKVVLLNFRRAETFSLHFNFSIYLYFSFYLLNYLADYPAEVTTYAWVRRYWPCLLLILVFLLFINHDNTGYLATSKNKHLNQLLPITGMYSMLYIFVSQF